MIETRIVALALAAWLASASFASARPTVFVVPLSVGTGVDFLARSLSDRLGKLRNDAVVVEDRPGGSGLIGTGYVAHAAPDGHTLLVTPGTILSDAAINHRPDPTANLDPVILLTTGQNGMVVGPRIQANSVRDVEALAKAHPGKLLYAAAGNGSVHTLSMELFKYLTKTRIERVPFTSSNDAVEDVVAGRVDMMILPVAASASFVQNHQLRMLAVLSEQRSSLFPDVPTMAEAGYPGMKYESYYFLMAPRGTPKPVIDKLNGDINTILRDPSFQPVLAKLGLTANGGTPAQLAALLHAEKARLDELVANTHMRVN